MAQSSSHTSHTQTGPTGGVTTQPTETHTTASEPQASLSTETPGSTAPSITADEILTALAATTPGSLDAMGISTARINTRDSFHGTDMRGSEADRVTGVIMAVITPALAERQHMIPAGSGRYDANIARRAGESFSPARTIPHLGTLLGHMRRTSIPPNEQTGASTISVSFHIASAELEMDQDPQGEILAVRVIHPSNLAGFDDMALLSLREAVPEITAIPMPYGRRSHWLFEVSNAFPETGIGTFIGATNEGWKVAGDWSEGTRIRYRIHRTSIAPLREPTVGEHTTEHRTPSEEPTGQ